MLSAMSGSSSMMSIKGFIFDCGLRIADCGFETASSILDRRIRNPQSAIRNSSCYLTMFDHQSFGHINNQLTDVGDVIPDAFKVFGDHQQPGGAPGRRRVARHPVEQVVKDAVVEPVDVVVALDHRA